MILKMFTVRGKVPSPMGSVPRLTLPEQMTFSGVCLRVCLVSNLVMMAILVHLQFSQVQVDLGTLEAVQDQLMDGLDEEQQGAQCPRVDRSSLPKYRMLRNAIYLSKTQYRVANPFATDPNDPNSTIYITSWTEVQPGVTRWFEEGHEIFNRCPNLHSWMKCHYTVDPSMFDRSHAVLVHARHMVKQRGIPPRLPHQKWIFYEVEAPTNVWNYADPNWIFWHHFNLTATFTRDSDIPYRLHEMNCVPKLKWKSPGINYAANKPGKIAWFVSHCNSSSRRELYVEELSKHIPVDIYGMCGNESVCNRDLNSNNESFNWAACMLDFLNKNYKYYLSFENSFCMDYVTEKLHRIYPINVIPIVLGQLDYDNFIPKGTFINIRNFESPRHLARYLKHLDRRDNLYNRYIDTKHSYHCRGRQLGSLRFHCRLCEYLHLHRHQNQRVFDAHSFWSVKNRCTSPKDFYTGVADEIIPKIQFTSRPDLFL